MTQHNDEHLTTEQLSALLDNKLLAMELIQCDAHLNTCQQCQARLAELRQTVVLLHALPKAELPRSFELPASFARTSERPFQQNATVIPIQQAQRRSRSIFQRSIRVISTIAAVVGIIFFLSGFLTTLPYFSGGASVNTAAPASAGGHSEQTPALSKTVPSSGTRATRVAEQPGGSPQYPTPGTGTPQQANDKATIGPNTSGQGPGHPSELPPFLDLGTVQGREGVGIILFALGVLGIVFIRYTRRRA